jgi:spore maturation protein SpmA
MEMIPSLVELMVAFGALITVGFAATEIAGYYNTRSANNSLVQTSTTAMNALVNMTGVMVTAEQAMTIAELTGVPTQIIKPATPTV